MKKENTIIKFCLRNLTPNLAMNIPVETFPFEGVSANSEMLAQIAVGIKHITLLSEKKIGLTPVTPTHHAA